MTTHAKKNPPKVLWWLIWFGRLAAMLVFYFVLQGMPSESEVAGVRFLPVIPLILSSIVRWMLLPRISDGSRAFPIFIVGSALAEGSTILGVILVPSLRQEYLALGLVGLAQYIPTFASRYKSA